MEKAGGAGRLDQFRAFVRGFGAESKAAPSAPSRSAGGTGGAEGTQGARKAVPVNAVAPPAPSARTYAASAPEGQAPFTAIDARRASVAPSASAGGRSALSQEDRQALPARLADSASRLLGAGGSAAAFENLLADGARDLAPPSYKGRLENYLGARAVVEKAEKLGDSVAPSMVDQARSRRLDAHRELSLDKDFETARSDLATTLTDAVLTQGLDHRTAPEEMGSQLGSIAKHLVEGGRDGEGRHGQRALSQWVSGVLGDERLHHNGSAPAIHRVVPAMVKALADVIVARDPTLSPDAAKAQAKKLLAEHAPTGYSPAQMDKMAPADFQAAVLRNFTSGQFDGALKAAH